MWYLELLFCFSILARTVFFWYQVYEGKTEEGIITGNNCIPTLLLFCSLLYGMRLCAISPVVRFSWTTAGQDLWLLAWPKNSRIPDFQISVSGKVYDVFCYGALKNIGFKLRFWVTVAIP